MANVLPFPTNQEQMTEYQDKYYFDKTAGKWYDQQQIDTTPSDVVSSDTLTISGDVVEPTQQEKFAEISQRIQDISGQISGVQQRVATEGITTAGGEMLQAPTQPTQPITTPITTPTLPQPTASTFDYNTAYDNLFKGIEASRIGIVDKITGLFKGDEKESPEETVNRLFPEAPVRVTAIDKQLGEIQTKYDQRLFDLEQRPGGLGFFTRERQNLDRQRQLDQQGLLLERDAIMGDYDRASERAGLVLGLEREQRKEEREDMLMAAQMELEFASDDEQLMIQAFMKNLERQELMEDRIYQQQIDENKRIFDLAASDPMAYSKYVAQYGQPKSSSELLGRIGQFTGAGQLQAETVGGFQVLRDASGNIISTLKADTAGGVSGTSVDSWVKLIAAGQADISNAPDTIRSQIVTGLSDLIPQPTNVDWVRKTYNEGKLRGESDEQQRQGMKNLGVPEDIINQVVPATPVVQQKPIEERAEEAGKGFGEIAPFLPEAFKETILTPYETVKSGITGFIKGLTK